MQSSLSLNSNIAIDAVTILEQPDLVSSKTITDIVLALTNKETAHQSLAALAAILLLAPDLADYVPLSTLDQYTHIKNGSMIWESLAILLLHSKRRKEIIDWLKIKWLNNSNDTKSSLLQYISDWFPEELNIDLLETIAKQNNSILPIEVLERQLFYTNTPYFGSDHQAYPLSKILSGSAHLLFVHNINDGQGDEIVRLCALLQAFIDKFPQLEITLFTDRLYLYDHPRIQTISIFDTDKFKLILENNCDGILNFFEQYLPSNTYNPIVQDILIDHLPNNFPPFYLWARKDVNHFVFESVIMQGIEYAPVWQVNCRRLALNYETTMRLIDKLGLPHRIGEQISKNGSVCTTNPHHDLVKSWESLKNSFIDRTSETNRLIAIVNIFGGQNAMKGYMPSNFVQLAYHLTQLIQEGYSLVLVPNGQEWGNFNAIEAIINCLAADIRKYIIAAPISDSQNPQEKMRQIKYFVSWADLIVTVEGWMMHLAYALGKPYRLLMAPYSYPSEWQPHGRSANQKHWIPAYNKKYRTEFILPADRSIKPPLLHYPEKDLLKAALKIWEITENSHLAKQLRFWMESLDKDIRSWAITTIGKIDPIFFQSDLINALEDKNRQVRAAAAKTLLDSEQNLTFILGEKWQEVLFAYQLIGEFRFQELRPLRDSASRSLKACLNGDDGNVRRNAKLIANEMQLNISI